MIEKTIDIATSDGTMTTYVFHPESTAPHPVIILYFDVFGIRNEYKNMCRRLCREGYYVALPSLFYRAGNPSYDPNAFFAGTLAIDQKDPLYPMNLNINTTKSMVVNDTGALLRHLDQKETLAKAQYVGSIGTCMGGRHALFAAATYPEQVHAFASIHGGKLVTDTPDSPHLAIPKLKAEGYFGWADRDDNAPQQHLDLYKQTLADHNISHHIDFMPNALHGYFFPERPTHYNPEAAEKSWKAVLDMFARQLHNQ